MTRLDPRVPHRRPLADELPGSWSTTDRGEAVLVDPGDEPGRMLPAHRGLGCRLRWLLATHGHFDHVGGAAAVQDRHDLPLRLHPADRFLVEHMPEQQAMYGLPVTRVPRITETSPMATGFASAQPPAVQTVPGHSPGQVMFVWDGHALVGDCVFAGSVGRTDLPGGDFATLEASIREKIYALPGHTVLHPGHGPDTTVERERRHNPYVNRERLTGYSSPSICSAMAAASSAAASSRASMRFFSSFACRLRNSFLIQSR